MVKYLLMFVVVSFVKKTIFPHLISVEALFSQIEKAVICCRGLLTRFFYIY